VAPYARAAQRAARGRHCRASQRHRPPAADGGWQSPGRRDPEIPSEETVKCPGEREIDSSNPIVISSSLGDDETNMCTVFLHVSSKKILGWSDSSTDVDLFFFDQSEFNMQTGYVVLVREALV